MKACSLPDGARSGQLLTNQDIDGRAPSCAVRTNDRHTQEDLGTGLREDELHRLVAQFEVCLLLQVLLHEQGESVAPQSFEDLHRPVLEPPDFIHVQVISGLVNNEHIAAQQRIRTRLHLHLPAVGEVHHGHLQVRRAIRAVRVSDASALHKLLARPRRHRGLQVDLVAGVHQPAPARLVHAQVRKAVVLHANLLVLNLVLHENVFLLVALWETLKLLVPDGAHQRNLTALVQPQQTEEPVAFEVHLRIMEQRERAVGQGKGALVQVYILRVLLLEFLRRLRCPAEFAMTTGVAARHVHAPPCHEEPENPSYCAPKPPSKHHGS